MSIIKFSFSAFLLSFVSYKVYYFIVKFTLSYFLIENTNLTNIKFEDFPLLHNTSFQAGVIGIILVSFLFLIKNYKIKKDFFVQALEIIFLSKISLGIIGFIYAKYQIENSMIQLQNNEEVTYCLKQFYNFNIIGVVLALFLIYFIFNSIRISFVNKYESINSNWQTIQTNHK